MTGGHTSLEARRHGLSSVELERAAERLAAEFAGIFNRETVERMLHDSADEYPKPWTDEVIRSVDVVVTMGCGDACPVFPAIRYVDWEVEDPAGQGLGVVRRIRDDIERRVRALLSELGVAAK